MYGYPGDTSLDFNEIYGSVAFGSTTVGMAIQMTILIRRVRLRICMLITDLM